MQKLLVIGLLWMACGNSSAQSDTWCLNADEIAKLNAWNRATIAATGGQDAVLELMGKLSALQIDAMSALETFKQCQEANKFFPSVCMPEARQADVLANQVNVVAAVIAQKQETIQSVGITNRMLMRSCGSR